MELIVMFCPEPEHGGECDLYAPDFKGYLIIGLHIGCSRQIPKSSLHRQHTTFSIDAVVGLFASPIMR